jgi:hypothetical protein
MEPLSSDEKTLLDTVNLVYNGESVSEQQMTCINEAFIRTSRRLSSVDFDELNVDDELKVTLDLILEPNIADLSTPPTGTANSLASFQEQIPTPLGYLVFCGLLGNLIPTLLKIMADMLAPTWRTFPILKKPCLVTSSFLNLVPGFVKKFVNAKYHDEEGRCTTDLVVFCGTPKTNRHDIGSSLSLVALPLQEWEELARNGQGYRAVDSPIPFNALLVMILNNPSEAFDLPSTISTSTALQKARMFLRHCKPNERSLIMVALMSRWLQVNVFQRVFNFTATATPESLATYDFTVDFNRPIDPAYPDIIVSASELASAYASYLVANSIDNQNSWPEYYAVIACYSSYFDSPLKGPRNFSYQWHRLSETVKNQHEFGQRFDTDALVTTGTPNPLYPQSSSLRPSTSTTPSTSNTPNPSPSITPSTITNHLLPNPTPNPNPNHHHRQTPATITSTSNHPNLTTTTPATNALRPQPAFRAGTLRQPATATRGTGRGRGRAGRPPVTPVTPALTFGRLGASRPSPYGNRVYNRPSPGIPSYEEYIAQFQQYRSGTEEEEYYDGYDA